MGQPRFSVVACALHIATIAPHKTSFDHEIVPGNSVFMLILRSFPTKPRNAFWLAKSLPRGSAPSGKS
jgi:hypothetical protein